MTARRLALAVLSAGQAMGQQVYERELISRAQGEMGPRWRVDPIEVRTLRSSRSGTVRIPSGLLGDAPPWLRRAAGRYVYPRSSVVHRLDLRLPPAPHPEVLTIHDAAPWRFSDEGSAPADAAATARNAAAVVCPSQFAADEISSRFDVADPVAIHNGVNPRFFDATPLTERQLEDLGLRFPFIVHAGGCTQRKNLASLAEAWPLVRSSRPKPRWC